MGRKVKKNGDFRPVFDLDKDIKLRTEMGWLQREKQQD